MKKLINLRIDENLLNDFKKICEKKGTNMTNVCTDLIKNYINKNKHLLIDTNKKEKYKVLSNLEKKEKLKEYEIILTKDDLEEIKNLVYLYYPDNENFETNFLDAKIGYIVNKLTKTLYPHLNAQKTTTQGVYELADEEGVLPFSKFNVFISNENGELIEGTPFDLANFKISEKEE